jgi:hypothetical protein
LTLRLRLPYGLGNIEAARVKAGQMADCGIGKRTGIAHVQPGRRRGGTQGCLERLPERQMAINEL